MTENYISAQDLHGILEKGLPADSILVDVRTSEEFKKGAIAGAVNLPVDKLGIYVDKLKNYKTIYLYCLSGGRSGFAQAQLPTLGVNGKIINLTSGLLAWRKEGYPLV